MEKYQNKYRIASTRAAWWNYGWNGAYFITICTRNREHLFGEIRNGEIILSNLGVIANVLWHEIPMHAPNVDLGDFIVMPNHIHGIVILNKPESKQLNNSLGFDSLKIKRILLMQRQELLMQRQELLMQRQGMPCLYLVIIDFRILAKTRFHPLLVHINLLLLNMQIV